MSNLHLPKLDLRKCFSSPEKTDLKRVNSYPSAKSRAIKLLLFITAIQSIFFLFVVSEPGLLLFVSTALCAFFLLIIACMPRLEHEVGSRGSRPLRWERILPIIVLALAIFKIVTRSDLYFSSIVEGFSFARQLVDNGQNSKISFHTIVNVFLTPLWINLIVARSDNLTRLSGLKGSAIVAVPLIALADMMLFGARTIFALHIVMLFVSGVLKPRYLAWVAGLFIVVFIYVHALRSNEMFEIGFSYLSLTSSGHSLPPINELDAIGMPNWTLGPLVLAQYISHSIGELIHLVTELPIWKPTFAALSDQMAAIGFGDRAISQTLLEQSNPGFGNYQTFFGSFIVDFGLVGIGIAMFELFMLVLLAHITRGHLRRVIVVLILSNLALASIENFFIIGGGIIQPILTIILAFTLSFRTKGGVALA